MRKMIKEDKQVIYIISDGRKFINKAEAELHDNLIMSEEEKKAKLKLLCKKYKVTPMLEKYRLYIDSEAAEPHLFYAPIINTETINDIKFIIKEIINFTGVDIATPGWNVFYHTTDYDFDSLYIKSQKEILELLGKTKTSIDKCIEYFKYLT